MSEQHPLVSVIIPSYRHERYIGEAIASIISQTYPAIELLIIDDASPDGTMRVAESMKEECEKRFVRTVMITKKKECTAASCNMGLDMAKGTYVYLIASDDVAEPHAIERLVECLDSHSDCVLAVGDNAIINEYSVRVGWNKEQKNVPLEEAFFKTFGELLSLYNEGPRKSAFGAYTTLLQDNHIPNGYLMRKEALDATGGYNTRVLVEDWYMNLQLAKKGTMVFLPEILFRYRWHDKNTIKTYSTRKIQKKIYRQIYLCELFYAIRYGHFKTIMKKVKELYPRKRFSLLRAFFYVNKGKRIIRLLGREFKF